ncbi:MAG: glycyl-radical enzyme activating protein [Ruminococcaceae bacterium]|nr:glycyl-radical enzyme activating protein [Oscillospiraceae bacterium]
MHTTSDKEPCGIITGVQRFSIHDGPGIRTIVFLKGCPLKCRWCHNPETQRFSPELMINFEKCIGCGACARVCKNHIIEDGAHSVIRENCTACGQCVAACPSALEISGKKVTVDEALKPVFDDIPFYREEGGLTLSGGEPLAQGEFAVALLKKAKEKGISTAVETCGMCHSDVLLRAAEYTDFFLYDIKETDGERHREFTGADNSLILKNLSLLSAVGARVILRVPVIPTVNDREEHFAAVGRIADENSAVCSVEILPYHRAGNPKYPKVGLDATEFPVPSREDSERYVSLVAKNTSKPVKLKV